MEQSPANRRFGIAWISFALALALHVTDEAAHDFLSTYNPSVLWIRARVPFLPLPTFTFWPWLILLIAGICLLLCLSPLAFRGSRFLRRAAWPIGLLVGVLNATGHISSSIYFRRWMPGVYSSPFLLAAAIYVLLAARTSRQENSTGESSAFGDAAARPEALAGSNQDAIKRRFDIE